jgi:hypothetical protein
MKRMQGAIGVCVLMRLMLSDGDARDVNLATAVETHLTNISA